jgi:asparagine synthase (glutamine-hydrolysing)
LKNVAGSQLRYRRSEECIEEFQQRLDETVADRLRNGRASLLMSGGLDSTSIAAAAVEGLRRSKQNSGLGAFTATYEQTCRDREGQFARLAAEALNIPWQCLSGDGYALFERAGELAALRPEPVDVSLGAFDDDFHRAAASHSRVALAGEGGDIDFHPQSGPYLLQMVKQFHLLRAASAVVSSIWHCHRLPPLLMGFKSLGGDSGMKLIPHWIESSFAGRNDLQARWRRFSIPSRTNHPSRPAAFAMLEGNFWPSLFENSDPGATGILMEMRYPFFDLRLLAWLLSLPPVPWCVDKWLLREAMREKLPEAVRRRPKSPLAADPVMAKARSGLPQEVERMAFDGEIRQYISIREFLPAGSWISSNAMYMKIRAISLNYWLQNRHKLLYNEAPGGIT